MPEFRPVVIRADESESLVRYCILSQLTAALPSRQVQLLQLLSAGPRHAGRLWCPWALS